MTKNFIPITHIDTKTNIKTIYKYKSKSPNYIFFTCKYKGNGKIDLDKKTFSI